MNIQQFQYVLAVVNSRNFEIAAERCYVTQSTLSTMIGRLEDEIGIKIFNRKTKPVSVTPEGEQLIERLRIVTHEIEQLNVLVQELKGEMVGELRIGIIPTVAPYILSRFLPRFVNQFPKVKTIVREMPTEQIQNGIKNRSLDIGILAVPIDDNELIEDRLYTEPFLIYDCRNISCPSRLSARDLDYSKLWLLQEGHCLRTQVYKICERSSLSSKSNLNFEFESGSMDSLLRFTKANQGLTIIPYLASLDIADKDKVKLVEFKKPTPVRSIGLLTHKYFVKKSLLKELKTSIRESVEKFLPKIDKANIIKPL